MESVWWDGAAVGYIDQRLLPHAVERRLATSVDDVVTAIATLAVRGAPAIGICGAYGVALASRLHVEREFEAAARRIRSARPTAVNLAWAVDRVLARADGDYLAEAQTIHEEQRETDRRIGAAAIEVFPDGGGNVLTHCNTGPLATGGDGTALGCFVAAHRAGKPLHVFADETRPLLQGARLTMFELQEAGLPCTLIVDSAAAITMQRRAIRTVVVGADRIALNGDTANKIGTYAVAIAAQYHRIPFYIAAPVSTFDFSLADGSRIPIEERAADEVRISTRDAVYNPAFDVTPAELIAGFITEHGVARPPYAQSLTALRDRARTLADSRR